MEHSVQNYLRRQSTELLEKLLVTYEEMDDALGISELIREVIKERMQNA